MTLSSSPKNKTPKTALFEEATMRISVTQRHINAGSRGSCTNDPIALALKDAGFSDPWVSVRTIQNGRGKEMVQWDSPREVQEFMDLFDNTRPGVQPFEFELEG